MKIGVLSLQGDFERHGRVLKRLDVTPVYVRRVSDLDGISGLIVPGGESTTILKLLEDEKLFDPLLRFAADRPWFGTCAGSILMAREVSHPAQRSFALLDIAIERNAYGRQVDSSIRRIQPSREFFDRAGEGDLDGVFIRAPIIRHVGGSVSVLAREQDHPVLVEQGPHLAATFHPEMGDDPRVHCLFLKKVRQNEERSG